MAVEFKDYYATLGVPRDGSDADIKKAFRKLARQFHPDVAKDKKAAEEKFKDINEANEVLSDPVKRKKYDQLGARWRDGGDFGEPSPPGSGRRGSRPAPGENYQEFHFGGTGFSDFFEQFFSAGSRHGFDGQGMRTGDGGDGVGSGSKRGGDIEGDLLVTLEESMHGTSRPISLHLGRSDGKHHRYPRTRRSDPVRVVSSRQEESGDNC